MALRPLAMVETCLSLSPNLQTLDSVHKYGVYTGRGGDNR